jgi:hypothetical protein
MSQSTTGEPSTRNFTPHTYQVKVEPIRLPVEFGQYEKGIYVEHDERHPIDGQLHAKEGHKNKQHFRVVERPVRTHVVKMEAMASRVL